MRAELVCIGTELLIGQVINTNATWLGQELAAMGVSLLWVTTVGDNPGRMRQALADAAARADLVITTGGLGPTADDITMATLADLLGEPLEERPEVKQHIEAYFAQRRRPISPTNLKMALFPPSADLIPNPVGTAWGASVRLGAAWVMTYPGVPQELHAMWGAWARPAIAARGQGVIHSVLLRYVGIGESVLAEGLADLLEGENPSVAPYAGEGEVHLRATARAGTLAEAQAALAPVLERLRAIAPYYYGEDDQTLPVVVGEALLRAAQTLATAESCTGGLVASRLTDVPGSSRWLRGGLVSYATDLKTSYLSVPDAVIAEHGVVSQAVAEGMATGARSAMSADWGVATTGWAGPAPDLPAEQVGLVWIAVAGPDGVSAECCRFGAFPRATIKQRASQAALDLLRRRINACLRDGA
ncbi:MAG: competence/damage-inducible protein A [Candidatus Sericytochromatia bacterium]|nr:competence/damage-inducible protein A [Candidatus Sericytochromatia bacterium]